MTTNQTTGPRKLTATDKVRAALGTRKAILVPEVAALAGVRETVAQGQLRKLAEAGHAVAKPGKAGVTWKLTSKGAAARDVAAATTAPAKAVKAARPTPTKATRKPSQKAVNAPAALRVPKAPAAATKPAGADLAATIAHMESVRPVSVQPATPAAKRTRRPNGVKPVYATFVRGALRDAVLSHLQLPATTQPLTATEVAKALNAQTGPVATNLDRMTSKGLVTLVASDPRRYAAA